MILNQILDGFFLFAHCSKSKRQVVYICGLVQRWNLCRNVVIIVSKVNQELLAYPHWYTPGTHIYSLRMKNFKKKNNPRCC